MVIYIVKMRDWNVSQTMWDLFQTSVFNAENLSLIVFGTLYAHAGLGLRVYASWPCTQAKDFPGFTFQKIDLFVH